MSIQKNPNTIVLRLQELHTQVEHKLWLAKTSMAGVKGTNKTTQLRLAGQLVALEEAISHFSNN